MFKRFVRYYKPYLKMFTLDMLASLFISLIGLLYPIMTNKILDEYAPNENLKMIIIFGCLLLLCYVIRMLLRFFVQYFGHIIGVKMQADMRRDMFIKLQKLPFSFYDEHETGKIMSRMTNDLIDVSELAHHGPENFFICGITIILTFIYLAILEWRFALILFLCVPALLIITIFLRKRMRNAFMETRKSIAEINASLESSITGIRVTKAFTNDEKELEKFEIGNNNYVEARKHAYKAMGQFHSSTSFIADIFNVVLLIAGGIFLVLDMVDLPDYVSFVVSIGIFINPLTTLINFTEQYQNGVTGFRRFLDILDQEEEKDDENAIDVEKLNGHIVLKNVNFDYSENDSILERSILSNINMDIESGKIIALVGPSGGGKTTICHLIPRFYDILDGEILIDGKNINSITRSSLRKNIGIVQQDVFLFNGTIKENILYGNPLASDEDIIIAAKRANIHDYVMTLEKGYDTQIGERGIKLSGGQKQRLSIARVFLKNPSILILDEATSALDNATELMIQESLNELCKGRTTIIVAHRLSTIRHADEIYVIIDGKVVEHGNHQDLLSEKEEYYTLYNAQYKDSLN